MTRLSVVIAILLHFSKISVFPHEFGLNSGELDWFDVDKKYIKINTIEDGTATLSFNELIKLLPEINGQKIENIHLYHNGKPYLRYILDDNGLIDENSILIFYARRAYSDTTFYDFYALHEPFFLFVDNSNPALTYELINDETITPLIQEAYIKQHVEHSTVYSLGSLYKRESLTNDPNFGIDIDSRTVMGEGWYWALLEPSQQRPVVRNSSELFLPIGENSNNLSISAHYRTIQDSIQSAFSVPTLTYYDLRLLINSEFKARDSITGYKFGSLNTTLSNSNIPFGSNLFTFESHQVYTTTNSPVGLRYYIIEGIAANFASNGKFELFTKGNSGSYKILGYHSDKIIALDTINQTISFGKNSQKGFVFGGGGELGKFTNLSLNDSHYRKTQSGLHLLYRLPDQDEVLYVFAESFSNELNNQLRQLPDGTEIVAVANSANILGGNKDEFVKLGSNSVNSITQGNIWFFATVKGNTARVYERVYQHYANAYGFLNSINGVRYSAEFPVKTSENLNILTRDLSSAEKPDFKLITFKNLADSNRNAKAIYLTHINFRSEVERLAEYRQSTQDIDIEVVDVDDVYNEFNFGKQSAFAIKKFLKHAYDNWNGEKVRYLFIIGDATWDVRKNYRNAVSEMFIPAYGNPVSDWWYGCLDAYDDFEPEILVARAPVNTLEQMRDYVNKLITYDTIPPNQWMKNILFLTGGNNANERRQFYNSVGIRYEDFILNPGFCGKINIIRKLDDSPSSGFQGGEIRNAINNGALWTIFIGHASAEVFDMDGWAASNLNNKDRYGFLTTISCNTGAFAEPMLKMSRNEQYLLQKEKGFVAVMGSTTVGFVGEHNYIASMMFEILSDKKKKERNLAEIFNYGKSHMAKRDFQLYTLYQFSLLGDPLIRVRLSDDTDLYLSKSDIKINSENNPNITENDDAIIISGILGNYGPKAEGEIELLLVRTYNQSNDSLVLKYNDICVAESFEFIIPIKEMPGKHSIKIIANPGRTLYEDNYANNMIEFNIDVLGNTLLPVDPLNFWNISSANPKFRFIEPLTIADFNYEFQIIDAATNNIVEHSLSHVDLEKINIFETHLEYNPEINLAAGHLYYLKYRRLTDNGEANEFNTLPFVASNSFTSNEVIHSLTFSNSQNYYYAENLSINNDELALAHEILPFKVISVKGVAEDGVDIILSHILIQVGDKVTADGPYDLGFSVTVIDGKEFPNKIRHKLFDTFGLYVNDSNWRTDSTSFRLVEFLRDSVTADDYVLIGNCKSSFRLPVYYKIHEPVPGYGSIDSLLAEFKRFGSYIADTLVLDKNNLGWDISFAMVGWRNAPMGAIHEGINMHGDSVVLEGFLTKFIESGIVKSQKIGPAQKWHSLDLSGQISGITPNITSTIYGIRADGSTKLIHSERAKSKLNLSFIDAKEFPYISIEYIFASEDLPLNDLIKNQQNSLAATVVNFQPAPEVAIVPSETGVLSDSYILGDDIELSVSIKNLALRASSGDLELDVNLRKSGGETLPIASNKIQLDPDEKINTTITFNSENFDLENSIFINLDRSKKLNELYTFNNSFSTNFRIGNDTTKPHVKLKFDGIDFIDGAYISRQPVVEVELYDNSKVLFDDPSLISVRINGYLHPFQRTKWHDYTPIIDDGNLKAVFRFMPDTLQYSDASIIVYYSDMAGNRDTLEFNAKVMLRNAVINEPVVVPNPASEFLSIEFMYAAPLGGSVAKIRIFDLRGEQIRMINHTLNVGMNKVPFDLRDDYGNSLPTGIYFFVLTAEGDYYHEAQKGKLMIVR